MILYQKMWVIERLAERLRLKGRGFNFEDTHMIDRERVKKLLVVLAIAFCWSHKTGEWRHEHQPIKIKKHGRPAVSLFRYGLDYLVDVFLNLAKKANLFKECLIMIRPVGYDFKMAEGVA